MADVQIWSGRVETELDAKAVTLLEPPAEMFLDADLDRPLAETVEQSAAQLTGPGPK